MGGWTSTGLAPNNSLARRINGLEASAAMACWRVTRGAADVFAVRHGIPARELRQALLGLRERSRALPLSHPLYSRVYHSHPPLLERLQALSALETADVSAGG